MSTPAIEIRDLEKRFIVKQGLFGTPRHVRAVDGVTLSIPTGATLGIVGESGCGKSTLARLILGLMPASAGSVLVEGQDLSRLDRRARARLIQPVFQDPFSSLNPRRRIGDIVAMPLVAQGIASAETRSRVAEMLAQVGIAPEMASRYPAQLSGGQRQRIAIARALVLRPRILLCDEPTSALDVSVQSQILNLLADLRRSLNLTTIFISHNLAVVEHIADTVAVMYLGRIVEEAPAQALFAKPRHPYTRALLASVLTPEPGLGVPDVGLGDVLPDPSNIPPGCRFHPRCPVAIARCSRETPPRVDGAECHLLSA